MSTLNNIQTLDRLLAEETVHGKSIHESEILRLIKRITADLLLSYDNQRQFIPTLLNVYERHQLKTTAYHIYLIRALFAQVEKLPVKAMNKDAIRGKLSFEEQTDLMVKTWESILNSGYLQVRISDVLKLPATDAEKQELIQAMNRFINTFAEKSALTLDDIQILVFNLLIAGNCCRDLKESEIFYTYLSSYLDLLYRGEHYQIARNTAEECIICGYHDDLKDLGFSLSFKAYASTGSTIAAGHYAICSFTDTLKKGYILDRQYQNWIWGLMKFFRNAGFAQWGIDLYLGRPKTLVLKKEIDHAVANTYFTCLLYIQEPDIPYKITEYLDAHREEIIDSGPTGVHAWLNTLYNILYNYKTHDGIGACKQYITIFENIVPLETLQLTKDIFEGDLQALMTRLKSSLVNLSETSFELDFTNDNKNARIISNQLIRKAFKEQNAEAYLLSMIVNGDHSLVFKKKKLPAISQIPNKKAEFKDKYDTFEEIKVFLATHDQDSFIWLGASDNNVWPMSYAKGEFSFLTRSVYKVSKMTDWYNQNVKILPFEEDKLLPSKQKAPKELIDFQQEETALVEKLLFSAIEITATRYVLLSKDYELSQWPHNLLLDTRKHFLINQFPLCNILSIEWLMDKLKQPEVLSKSYTKSCWIPQKTGDYTLNYLHHLISHTLEGESFIEYDDVLPPIPLQSDLNIIGVHGGQEIHTTPYFHAKSIDEKISYINVSQIIGQGKILIFFVCHSGSMKSDFLRNRVTSLIRDYLQSGYQAVIAPFWALDISIAEVWLPAFMNSLNNGHAVIQAMHDGNMAVRAKYPTPNAYTCLHLYGNPYFSIGS